jgi:hypothetical protein
LEGWDHESNGISEVSQSGEWKYKVIGNVWQNPELLNAATPAAPLPPTPPQQ